MVNALDKYLLNYDCPAARDAQFSSGDARETLDRSHRAGESGIKSLRAQLSDSFRAGKDGTPLVAARELFRYGWVDTSSVFVGIMGTSGFTRR